MKYVAYYRLEWESGDRCVQMPNDELCVSSPSLSPSIKIPIPGGAPTSKINIKHVCCRAADDSRHEDIMKFFSELDGKIFTFGHAEKG